MCDVSTLLQLCKARVAVRAVLLASVTAVHSVQLSMSVFVVVQLQRPHHQLSFVRVLVLYNLLLGWCEVQEPVRQVDQ
jgi:hypothetical protein